MTCSTTEIGNIRPNVNYWGLRERLLPVIIGHSPDLERCNVHIYLKCSRKTTRPQGLDDCTEQELSMHIYEKANT